MRSERMPTKRPGARALVRSWPPRLHQRRCGPKPAFTLVEVLVVVAIVTLLVAVLLPSLARARVVARRTVCASQLWELGKGWRMYLNDSTGLFPQWVNIDINYGGQQGAGAFEYGSHPLYPVHKPLNPYVGLDLVSGAFGGPRSGENRKADRGAALFRCPSDTGTVQEVPTHHEYYGTSYLTNALVVGQDQVNPAVNDPCRDLFIEMNPQMRRMTESKVSARPSRFLLMGDHGWRLTWEYVLPSTRRAEWHHAPCRHMMLFLDGHADFVRIRKGVHVHPDYAVIPFDEWHAAFSRTQSEVPCD